jgi:ABC-type uncharacterized transport system permease subunit
MANAIHLQTNVDDCTYAVISVVLTLHVVISLMIYSTIIIKQFYATLNAKTSNRLS